MYSSFRPGQEWLDKKAMGGRQGDRFRHPDKSPRAAGELPHRLLRHMENTSIARYVWLPIEWEGDKPVIRWRDEWTI